MTHAAKKRRENKTTATAIKKNRPGFRFNHARNAMSKSKSGEKRQIVRVWHVFANNMVGSSYLSAPVLDKSFRNESLSWHRTPKNTFTKPLHTCVALFLCIWRNQ